MPVQKILKPVTIRLQNGDEISVQNLNYYNKLIADQYSKSSPPTIGYWDSFSRNANVEYGTITHQMTTDINGDGNPPVVPIAPICIFDQNKRLTFDTFIDRPYSTIDRDSNPGGAAVPSVNLSGAIFDSFPLPDTLQVQSTTGNPIEKFPEQGKIMINKEVISYNGKSISSPWQLLNIIRQEDDSPNGNPISGDYLITISTT